MLLAFFTCDIAQRQCNKNGYRNRHSNADHYEFIIDTAV